MANKIKISVIIPMYNVENYIEQCLESVICQDFNEKEIIIIDDGSIDRSYDIACRYSEKYNYIQIFKQKNQGQSVARNKGISYAKGEYIFFLDSDDYISKGSLEYLYKICKKNDLDIIKTEWYALLEESNEKKLNKSLLIDIHNKVITCEEYFKRAINSWYNVIPWNGLIKKSFLEKFNIRFPEGIQFEDNTFALKVYTSNLNAKIMQIEYPFYYVRIRQGSTTTEVIKPKKIYDMLSNIYIMNEFINKYEKENEFKNLLKIAVSILVFHMTSYYYRIEKNERKKIKKTIPKYVLKEAIKYPGNKFQRNKIWLFLYAPYLLDMYQKIKNINSRRAINNV